MPRSKNKKKIDFLLVIPREEIRGGWNQRSSYKSHCLHHAPPKSTWKFAVEGCIFKKSQKKIKIKVSNQHTMVLPVGLFSSLNKNLLQAFVMLSPTALSVIPEFILSVSQKSLTTTDSKVDQDLQKEALWLNLSSRDYGSQPLIWNPCSAKGELTVDFLTQRLGQLYYQQAVYSH